LVAVLVILSLLKGSGKDSMIGVKRCDSLDWTLFGLLQVLCIIWTVVGIVVVKREYHEKIDVGYEFIPGDLEATPKNLVVMIGMSFLGAFCAAFCGIGPGNIFCPALVMIGI